MKKVSIGRTLNLFLTTIIVPLLIISIFAMYYATSFLSELSKNNNLQIAENLKVSVENFFSEPENDLRILRDLLLLDELNASNMDEYTQVFEIYHKNQSKFHHYNIVDVNGISIYNYPLEQNNVGFDYSNSEYYNAIQSGSEKFWSKTHMDTRFSQISIDFALPLQDHILTGTIQLESLSNVLNSILEEDGVIVGITDNTGVYILHSNYTNVEQRITDPYVNRRVLNYEEVQINNDNYFGTNIRSNYQGWNIVLYEHVSKQRDKVLQFSIILSVIIVASTLVVILLGNRLNSILVENLSSFVNRTKSIADGDYSESVDESRYIEFNEIGSNFSLMAEKIQKRESKIVAQNREIETMNRNLELRVQERTKELQESNEMLEQTLSNLNETREQLIESEKLASLGNLVAGLAHEINTPLGIILTVVTYMQELTEKIKGNLSNNALRKNDLLKYTQSMEESEILIFDNVTRTTDLIGSFKLISSDQMSDENRMIDLVDYIENIVRGLEPSLKKKDIHIELMHSGSFEIKTIPGSVYQVMVNLIMNAALHAYEHMGGTIEIELFEDEDTVDVVVRDYGKGITEENLKRIYEPFFTTKRGSGGTGLGLNITYNAIKQSLKGNITAQSEIGKGTAMRVTLPKNIEEKKEL